MFLAEKGPGVCEIVLTPGYIFSPKTSSKKLSDGRIVSSSLDDMYPFLERKEFLSNKIQGNIG
jgi:acetolactate synthase-1/2/3 large subunit